MLFSKRNIQLNLILLALAAAIGFSYAWWAGLTAVFLSAMLAVRKRQMIWLATVVIGLIRGWLAIPEVLPSTAVVLTGVIRSDVIIEKTVRFTMTSDWGRIDVFARDSQLRFGDEVSVKCESLTRRSIFREPVCLADKVKVLRPAAAPGLWRGLNAVKQWMIAAIDRGLPVPEGPLLAGILLGTRFDLPDDLAESFRRTGTSHIVAVSGYNVTIVVTLMASLIGRLPLPRRVVTWLTIGSIVSFVILTGASASVVRAGIMGGLVVVARSIGRLSDAAHTLVISATLMVFVDPATVADVGFQLSVAATAGLVLLADPYERWLWWLPARLGLRSSLASTLAAITLTEPLIAIIFGRVSVIAAAVNVIVLPFVPLAMALGFAAAVVSGIVPLASTFVGWLAWAPLFFVVTVVDRAAALPLASVGLGPTGSLFFAAIGAGVAMFMIARARRHAV
ncbi:MAG: ComEC/Rec2 family competence protein [Candidatus Kerfeldbacteria bacterium]|nr:ComEC/Rec2 family competence protein [Candidatus Kerfeldbacteria bacterium]